MANHVVIGAGPAGLNAIETIRQIDRDGASITLICDEPAYSRMALPYFLAREIPQEQLATGSAAYFERLRVETRFGARAAAVDAPARSVRLDGGESIPFDTLLIASGSAAARPAIPGADGRHVHNIWTLADAQLVAATKGKRPSAVLVGAGFIGLIILNALHKRGWKLSVVEQESHILPRMLDRRGAQAAERWLRDRGIDLYTGCGVTEIAGARKKTVALSDGQTLSANVVLLATGIRPQIAFLKDSGVRTDHGVVVDDRLQSSVPGIYAAGDVAQGPDLLGGPAAIHAIQPTAVDHGRVAGANMAGKETRYPGSLVMNILDIAGLHCASFGTWRAEEDTTIILNPSQPVYRKYVWQGARLVGGIMLGPVEDTTMLTDVGMLKGLIQTRADLGEWKHYLNERPWDLRRAYIAGGAASGLLQQTTVGAPSTARAFHFQDKQPGTQPSPHHADLVGTRPAGFESLPRTPTPGIYKPPVPESAE
jgi:NAD(P)H-nitrite reductase large subunit